MLRWKYSPETPLHPIILALIRSKYGSQVDFHKRLHSTSADAAAPSVKGSLGTMFTETSMVTRKKREIRRAGVANFTECFGWSFQVL